MLNELFFVIFLAGFCAYLQGVVRRMGFYRKKMAVGSRI